MLNLLRQFVIKNFISRALAPCNKLCNCLIAIRSNF